MDLALNNLQRLICHKTQPTNQPTNQQMQIQANTKHRQTLLFWLRTFLLTSDFSSSTRGERQFLKKSFVSYNANNTPNVRHISWCFRSQFIFAGRDPKKLNRRRNGRKLNLMAETQLSACMVQSQILNSMVGPQLLNTNVQPQLLNTMVGLQLNLFSKSSTFFAHLFWGWRHPHSSSISSLGFIIKMVIVISFAHERKLYQWTTHLNSWAEDFKAQPLK